MARLPIPRKRPPSKREQVVKRVAKAWVAVKVASAGARAARGGAKAYGTAKDTTKRGKGVAKLLAIPAAVAGGVVVWRKTRSGDQGGEREPDFDRPLGPVASAETVSPPPPESSPAVDASPPESSPAVDASPPESNPAVDASSTQQA